MMSKKSPQLRFEGFTDDWEQRKLKDIVNRVTRKNKNLESTLPLTISAQYGLVDQITFFNKQIASKDMSGYYLLQKGEFAYNKSYSKDFPWGAIKRLNMYDEGVLSTLYIAFLPFKVNSDFLVSYYETDGWHKEVAIRAAEGARNHGLLNITAVDFFDTGLMIPPNNDEQQEIGGFFIELDHTITLHQRKLDLLKEQKKGFLQKMFPKNGAKVPELRFAGFADDWEERKLSDIADRFDNLRVPITASDRKPGDTPYYGANGIQDYVEGFTHNGEFILVAEDGANDLKNYPVQYVNGKVWVNNHAHVLQGKKTITDNKFLMNAIKNFNIEPFLVGGGRAKLNADVMMKLNILLPTFVEQEKIGSLFSLLDKTIALHQRKLDLLKEQKKGYLQKMFPKTGEKIPELRFAGFADDWEQRKLNEVSDIYDGTHQTPKYQDNGVMFLSVENIKTLTSNKFISREAFEDEFKIRPQRGDILMTRIGDIGTANVVETDEDLAYYVSLALFKSEELNPYFLQASIYAPFVQDQIWKRTLHIAFPKKINKNEIGQVPINVPTLAEQTKIGSFFKQLDNTITLHQRKLDLLKEQKKGFLQKMFV